MPSTRHARNAAAAVLDEQWRLSGEATTFAHLNVPGMPLGEAAARLGIPADTPQALRSTLTRSVAAQDELARDAYRQLGIRGEIPTSPNEVADLRMRLGDTRTIFSDAGAKLGIPSLLIATESHVAGAPGIAAELAAMSDWFASHGDLQALRPSRPLQFFTDDRHSVGEAITYWTEASPQIFEGPRDPVLIDTMLQLWSRESQAGPRALVATAQGHEAARLAHEGAHVGMLGEWPSRAERHAAAAREDVWEERVAEEALADVFAAARGQRTNIGYRDVAVLQPGAGTFEELLEARKSPYLGVQLLAKPIVKLADANGWDVVPHIASDAIQSLGGDLRSNRLAMVGVQDAAVALLDAAETHLPKSTALRTTELAWKQLGVL